MDNNQKIDFSRFTGSRLAENHEVSRLQNPRQQLRSQAEVERHPTYFQRQQEREGRSEWSGGSMGGGTWGGRSR